MGGMKEFWYDVFLFGCSVNYSELRSNLFISCASVLGRSEVILKLNG